MLASLRKNRGSNAVFDVLIMILLLGLFIGAIAISRNSYAYDLTAPVNWRPWLDSFFQNSGTEMLGALLTFIMLEVIRGHRARQAEEAAEKVRSDQLMNLQRELTQELQKQLRSFIQGQTISRLRAAKTKDERQPILNEMQANDLLQGVNLKVVNLQGANLSDARLQYANLNKVNLQGAFLMGADLEGTALTTANLQDVNLTGANLQWADLIGTNLQEATLTDARLQGAILFDANLQGARLSRANLQGVENCPIEQLQQAETLNGATLPDGTQLPDDDTWEAAFEDWRKTVEVDDMGYIIPAEIGDNSDNKA